VDDYLAHHPAAEQAGARDRGPLSFPLCVERFHGSAACLTRQQSFTLALALQSYQAQQGGIQWHYLMAASAATTLPIIVRFFLTQKTFIQGIATTGSKG
jgi:ABC-type glycerol-3-phosphate transport system permease component